MYVLISVQWIKKNLLVVVIAVSISTPLIAQESIRWGDLTSQQQDILKPVKSDWGSFPAQRQKQ